MTTYRYVAEITVVTDGAGTTLTSYFGTSGFATKPTDTPDPDATPSPDDD